MISCKSADRAFASADIFPLLLFGLVIDDIAATSIHTFSL